MSSVSSSRSVHDPVASFWMLKQKRPGTQPPMRRRCWHQQQCQDMTSVRSGELLWSFSIFFLTRLHVGSWQRQNHGWVQAMFSWLRGSCSIDWSRSFEISRLHFQVSRVCLRRRSARKWFPLCGKLREVFAARLQKACEGKPNDLSFATARLQSE